MNIVKLCEILSKWCFKLSRISVALQPRCWQKFDKFSWPTSWGRQDPKSKPITKLLTPKIGKKESLIHGENPKNQALCLGETGLPEHWRTAKQPETLIIRTKRTVILDVTRGKRWIRSIAPPLPPSQGKVEKCRKKCKKDKFKKQWIVHHWFHWLGILKSKKILRDQVWVVSYVKTSHVSCHLGIACCAYIQWSKRLKMLTPIFFWRC